MAKEKKILWNGKLPPFVVNKLIKVEAKRTGESEADIVEAALLLFFMKKPDYQESVRSFVQADESRLALFEAFRALNDPDKLPRRHTQ